MQLGIGLLIIKCLLAKLVLIFVVLSTACGGWESEIEVIRAGGEGAIEDRISMMDEDDPEIVFEIADARVMLEDISLVELLGLVLGESSEGQVKKIEGRDRVRILFKSGEDSVEFTLSAATFSRAYLATALKSGPKGGDQGTSKERLSGEAGPKEP